MREAVKSALAAFSQGLISSPVLMPHSQVKMGLEHASDMIEAAQAGLEEMLTYVREAEATQRKLQSELTELTELSAAAGKEWHTRQANRLEQQNAIG